MKMWKGFVNVVGVVVVVVCSSTAHSAVIGHWTFNEGNGTVAYDSSGYDNNGQITFGNGNTKWSAGLFGTTGLKFNSNWQNPESMNYEVTVPNNPILEPAAFTAEAWFRSAGTQGAYVNIIHKGASAYYGISTWTMHINNNILSLKIPTAGLSSPAASSSIILDGKWHHVAGTYDGSSVRLYVDGAEIGSGTPYTGGLVYNMAHTNDLSIGSWFNGYMDEVTLWDRALSAEEIANRAKNP